MSAAPERHGGEGLLVDEETPDPDVRAVLRITAYRRLWLALGFSSFGDWLGLLAITALADYLTRGNASEQYLAVAGVFILRLAPSVVLGPLAGALADRISRRWTLVYGDALRFVILASIPFVGTLWWLYAATLLIECVGLFWLPAKDATMPNLVPRKRLEAANQLSLIATYGTAPIAALAFSGVVLLNGMLVHAFHGLDANGAYLGIWIDALSYLISGLTIWRLQFPASPGPRAAAEEPLWRTIVEGWKFVGGTPLIRGLVVGMLGAFAAGGLVIGLGLRFATDLGSGPAGYSVLFAAVFFGLAGGMWLGPRLLAGLSRRRLFGLAITAAGGWLILLSLVPNMVVAVFLTIGLGSCGGVAWVSGYTLLGLEVDDAIRGRTFAFVQSLVRVVLISVLALGPALAALLGTVLHLPHEVKVGDNTSVTYTPAMAVFLLAGLLAGAIGLVAYRQMDDRKGISLWSDLFHALRRTGDMRVLRPERRPYPGFFVALEGGDGVGKSTQAARLREWLVGLGHEVLLTHEPGGTAVGQRMRQVLLHGDHLTPRSEVLLFAADRAEHVETVIRPALERGVVVVTDRYVDSSLAYQGAGRELGGDEVASISAWATAGLVPDLTVVLDLPAEEAMARRGDSPDRVEAESAEFHEAVRARFVELAAQAPVRYLVVNATATPEHLQDQVRARLAGMLPESASARAERETAEREAADRERAELAASELADQLARAEDARRVEEERRVEQARKAETAAAAAEAAAAKAAEHHRHQHAHRLEPGVRVEPAPAEVVDPVGPPEDADLAWMADLPEPAGPPTVVIAVPVVAVPVIPVPDVAVADLAVAEAATPMVAVPDVAGENPVETEDGEGGEGGEDLEDRIFSIGEPVVDHEVRGR